MERLINIFNQYNQYSPKNKGLLACDTMRPKNNQCTEIWLKTRRENQESKGFTKDFCPNYMQASESGAQIAVW